MSSRIDEIRADLASVRQRIREATEAASVSADGRSLTRQGLDVLVQREGQLEWALHEALTGSPFGRTEFVRPYGRVQSYPYYTGQDYEYGDDDTPTPGAVPTIGVEARTGGGTISVMVVRT